MFSRVLHVFHRAQLFLKNTTSVDMTLLTVTYVHCFYDSLGCVKFKIRFQKASNVCKWRECLSTERQFCRDDRAEEVLNYQSENQDQADYQRCAKIGLLS